jgi:transcriptional antiterminator RfaH
MARDQLRDSGIEAFLPSYVRASRWGVRGDLIKIETPLFPGYLFARFDPGVDLETVKHARGVSQVVGPGSRPLAVGDEVIDTLRRACQNSALVSPVEYVPFRQGERVTIARGPFAGLSGIVDRTRSRARIIISIEILQRACAVEIPAAELLRDCQ